MLRFASDGVERGAFRCPACSAVASMPLVLTADWQGRELDLVACPACEARFYEPPPRFDYSGHTDSIYSIRHYVEIGAGISVIYEVLFRHLTSDFDGRLLDIGCGYGFSLDLVRTLTRGSAVGADPSRYGEVGARELGVVVHRGYAEEVEELAGQTFDVVFSSEVLEHATDPAAFLASVGEWLTPDGMLILTTPNAATIEPGEMPEAALLPILSLGAHAVLYTPRALARVLRRNGFEHVEVIDLGRILLCYASRAPFVLRPEPEKEELLRYFRTRLADPELAPSTRAGLAYRYFRDCVNTRRVEEAESVVDLVQLPTLAQAAAIDCEEGLAAAMPYCAPCFAYYRGALELNDRDDPAAAADTFALARALLELKLRLLPDSSPEEESLLEPAAQNEEEARRRLEAARPAPPPTLLARLRAAAGRVIR